MDDKLCIWKDIANRDAIKGYEKEKSPTFSKDKKCVKCSGYETSCPEYISKK